MKMRASLLQFAGALSVVVLAAAMILALVHRNLMQQARLGMQSNHSSALSAKIGAQYGQLPLSFEANVGQTAPEVQFLSHGYGYELFLTHQEAVLALRHSAALHAPGASRAAYLKELRSARRKDRTSILRLHFSGANSQAEVSGIDRLPGRTDYFIGSDPANWRTGVPSYRRVAYRGIYPGIDAAFYGNQRRLEYDFFVSPGADPAQIVLDVEGASGLSIDAKGNLMMDLDARQVTLLRPTVYQQENGQRTEIAANYVISDNHVVKFLIGRYDTRKPLVIDPVLDYSTYLGGSALNTKFNLTDFGYGIAVDSNGDAYVTGQTFSLTFPTTKSPPAPIGGYTPSPPNPPGNPNGAVFVTELNPGGTEELYSTYLIGTDAQGDYGFALALDPTGKIYVTGQTFSTQFPTTKNAVLTAPVDSTTVTSVGTAFLSEIDPTISGTNSLVYSSYLGGSGGPNFGDVGWSVAVDANSNAYVVGNTASQDFFTTVTTATGYQTTNSDTSNGVAFLVVVNTAGSGVTYATYLGGDGKQAGTGYGDVGFGVAVDSSGNAYLAGETTSSNFPTTTTGYLTGPNANNLLGEGFVSVINTTAKGTGSLVYSSYLGGEVEDLANAVSLEPNNTTPANAVYVTGTTTSTQFPVTPGAYASTTNGAAAAFVSLLDSTSSGKASLKYSALVGGSGGNSGGNGIRVDSSGNAYVDGSTGAANFPLTSGAFQTSDNNSLGTAFVFELNPGGSGTADLLYSTYFGGSGPGADTGWAIALDPSNNVYITGSTGSTDLPISAGAFQTKLTGSDSAATTSAFVAELTLEPTLSFSATTLAFDDDTVGTLLTNCPGLSPCAVTLTNNTSAAIPITVGAITGATGFAAGAPSCGASVVPGTTCTIAVTFDPTSVGAEVGTLPISFTAGNNTTASTQNITLTGTGTNFTVQPTSLTFPFQLITSTSAQPQTVTLTNSSAAAISFTTMASAGFAESDTCNLTVPANSACMLSVTFTPAAAGPATGTLTVTSSGINETVQLSGNGGDFSVTMPASINVTNNSGSGTATLAWTSGFTSPPSVSFSCTTTITNLSCAASPNPVAAAGSFSIMVSGSAAVPPASRRFDVWKTPIVPVTVTILALLALPLLRRRRAWLGFAAVVLACALFSACSGGHTVQTGSLTLTGSATSGSTTVSHPFSTSVTVQ